MFTEQAAYQFSAPHIQEDLQSPPIPPGHFHPHKHMGQMDHQDPKCQTKDGLLLGPCHCIDGTGWIHLAGNVMLKKLILQLIGLTKENVLGVARRRAIIALIRAAGVQVNDWILSIPIKIPQIPQVQDLATKILKLLGGQHFCLHCFSQPTKGLF